MKKPKSTLNISQSQIYNWNPEQLGMLKNWKFLMAKIMNQKQTLWRRFCVEI